MIDEDYIRKLVWDILNESIEVPIVVEKGGVIPSKGTSGAAAYDLTLCEDTDVVNGRFLAKLNIRFKLPYGYAAIIKPRSGYTLKGMKAVNIYGQELRIDADVNDGVIDSDYTGLVGVLMQGELRFGMNYKLKKGTSIAQMLIVKVADVKWKIVDRLEETERGEGGYGHTDEKKVQTS